MDIPRKHFNYCAMPKHYQIGIYGMLLLFSSFTFAQNSNIKSGHLIAKDTFKLDVIRVYPDSFPNISIVFKAENKFGIPLWDLKQKDMQIKEDDLECKIVSLEKISKQKTVLLELVVDHSGSMEQDNNLLYDKDFHAKYRGPDGSIYPPGYQTPLTVAKRAVLKLIDEMDLNKDSVGFIGFSSHSDYIQEPTSNISELKRKINAMDEVGGTAFYDAVSLALDKIKNTTAIKAVIALTDGQDNESHISRKALIQKAKRLKIPVYIIGLGDVEKNDLGSLTKQMGGEFFYTRSSGALSSIYKKITQKIMAVYEVKYASPNLSSKDSVRETMIDFLVDSFFLTNNILKIELPKEVLKMLKQKEKENGDRTASVQQAINDIDTNNTSGPSLPLIGLLVLACVAGAGSVVVYKRFPIAVAKSFVGLPYPNPAKGEVIKLPYNLKGGDCTVQVMDINGRKALNTVTINGEGELNIDLTNRPTGNYFIKLTDGNGLSEVRRVIVLN